MPCRAHLPRQHASAARRRGLAMRIGKRSPRREDMCQATAGARALGLVTGSPPRQDLAPMARARRWPQRRAARLVRRRGRSGLGQERTSAIRARTDWRVALRGAVTVGQSGFQWPWPRAENSDSAKLLTTLATWRRWTNWNGHTAGTPALALRRISSGGRAQTHPLIAAACLAEGARDSGATTQVRRGRDEPGRHNRCPRRRIPSQAATEEVEHLN